MSESKMVVRDTVNIIRFPLNLAIGWTKTKLAHKNRIISMALASLLRATLGCTLYQAMVVPLYPLNGKTIQLGMHNKA